MTAFVGLWVASPARASLVMTRVGLYLTDDGNTIYWTLDGEVMDRVDITSFFSSSPESVKDGAHVTISGAGYQPHMWKIDDVVIYASP